MNTLTEQDFLFVADSLKVELAALKAVEAVETAGRGGFFAPGKPALLFEGHIFWAQLKKRGISPEEHVVGNETILYSEWIKSHYLGGIKEYTRLEKARVIHPEAADASASWGMFQLMGFNHQACGYSSVAAFVDAMCTSEAEQLEAFAHFIKSSGLVPFLQNKDWAGFARRYNGPRYAENQYDVKLDVAYQKLALPSIRRGT